MPLLVRLKFHNVYRYNDDAILRNIWFHWLFLDINKYKTGIHNCSKDGFSNNIRGSFNCSCKPGFEGDGYNCTGTILPVVYFCQWSFLKYYTS